MAREWTDAQITDVKALIASGVQSVTFQGRGVTYHGVAALQALLAQMIHDRDAAAETPRYKRFATKKGLGE